MNETSQTSFQLWPEKIEKFDLSVPTECFAAPGLVIPIVRVSLLGHYNGAVVIDAPRRGRRDKKSRAKLTR